MPSKPVSLIVIAATLWTFLDTNGPASRLWGRLEPGRFGAGFLADAVTVAGQPPFAVGLWYPTRASGGQPMLYRDYVGSPSYGLADADARKADFGKRLTTWSGWTPNGVGPLFRDGVTPVRLEALLDQSVAARSGAAPAPGPFPAIVIATGATMWNPLLGEYLASHGFLVVTYNDFNDRGAGRAPDLAAQRRDDLGAVLAYVRARPQFGGRLTLFGTGSGTAVSFDVVARGAAVDALIVQGGAVPAVPAEAAAAVTTPILHIRLADRPAEWLQRWDAAWQAFRRSPRLTLGLPGGHAELLAASRLAYPDRAGEQHLFDAFAAALRAFATESDAAMLRAAVAPSAERAGGLTLDKLEGSAAAPAPKFANINPAWSPDGRRLLFQSERSGGTDIYVMDADGANVTRLTEDPAADTHARWAPDGKRFVFDSERGGAWHIYVANADGSGVRRVTTDAQARNGAAGRHPDWSRDGLRLVFDSNRDGDDEIYVSTVDGSKQDRITRRPGTDGHPVWSPDGKRILFGAAPDGNRDIFTVPAGGGEPVNLTRHPAMDLGAKWSPDGARIVFTSTRDGSEDIFVMASDGSGPAVNLTKHPDVVYESDWSPDGRRIAFYSSRPGDFEIFVMAVDGTGLTQLTGVASPGRASARAAGGRLQESEKLTSGVTLNGLRSISSRNLAHR